MNALSLFDDIVTEAPETEGIKYAGSKQKLLPHILTLIQKVKPKTVLDGFSGTTRVSQALAQSGYTVFSNDTALWSEAFASCYLLNERPTTYYAPLIAHLNSLPPQAGWFTEHYGGDPQEKGAKRPWQRHNTMRLDAIREEIDALGLPSVERSVLLTSLIRALDSVDSTLGHYASYLSDWSPRSYNPLRLKVPRLLPKNASHRVFREGILSLLPKVEAELAYFDPPYGSNNDKMPPSRVRYAAYYHLWTTVILNDRPPVFGKANRRTDSSDTIAASAFEEFRRNSEGNLLAVQAIQSLLKNTRARYIILSYSSGGRATAQELTRVLSESGTLLEVCEIDYKRNVMANMRWTHEWTPDVDMPNREFLFLLEKG